MGYLQSQHKKLRYDTENRFSVKTSIRPHLSCRGFHDVKLRGPVSTVLSNAAFEPRMLEQHLLMPEIFYVTPYKGSPQNL